jgi:high affinity Mn2+ porin
MRTLFIILFCIALPVCIYSQTEVNKSNPIDSLTKTPPEFLFADTNNDGYLSDTEVNDVIYNYFESTGGYNLKTVARLVLFHNRNTPNSGVANQMRGILNQAVNDSIKKANGPNYALEAFDHKVDKYISVGGQITSMYQYQSALVNPKYSGPVSISEKYDEQTITMATINLLFNFWKTGDIIISPELQIGNGIGNGAGMGAYPNALFGFPQPTPYLFRGQFRQHFFNKDTTKKFKEFNFTVGRFVLQEMFDVNAYAGDPKKDFSNFNHTMLGGWDAATTAYGYTHGFATSFIFEKSSINLCFNTVNKVAGGPKTDWNVGQAYSTTLQFVKNFKLFGKDGKVRLLGFYNSYNGGSFDNFFTDSLGTNAQFDTVKTYVNKLGGGIDINYDLTENSGLFLRYSADDGKHEDFGYTQCDGSINAGALLGLKLIKRPFDRFGISGSYNILSAKQQKFLKAGGTSFMLGDGDLNYAPETAFESFYSINFFHHFYLTLNYQYILNVGYNADRGNAHFLGLRLNLEL